MQIDTSNQLSSKTKQSKKDIWLPIYLSNEIYCLLLEIQKVDVSSLVPLKYCSSVNVTIWPVDKRWPWVALRTPTLHSEILASLNFNTNYNLVHWI